MGILKDVINQRRDYKSALEAFHGGHSGSGVVDIVCFVLHAPPLLLLLNTIRNSVIASSHLHDRSVTSLAWCVALEFFVLVLPLLGALTLGADRLCESLLCVLTLAAALHLLVRARSRVPYNERLPERKRGGDDIPNKDDVLNNLKGIVVLGTCLSILAVDFQVFPRKFSKTERYGTSLMDVGTGLFICSSSLTSKHAMLKDRRIMDVKKPMIITVLGVVRMLLTAQVEYQEHVSEYGTHWNFFFTLASVWVLADIVHSVSPDARFSAIVGLCVAVGHQYLVSTYEQLILSAPREGFALANREGLLSASGSFAIFLIGEFSFRLCQQPASLGGLSKASKFAILSGAFWACWYVSSTCIQPTSRRFSNAAYGSLVLAVTHLLLCCLQYVRDNLTSPLRAVTLRVLTRCSLIVFLLANLMTGVVNFSIQTLYASDTEALVILILYSAALSTVVSVLATDKEML